MDPQVYFDALLRAVPAGISRADRLSLLRDVERLIDQFCRKEGQQLMDEQIKESKRRLAAKGRG